MLLINGINDRSFKKNIANVIILEFLCAQFVHLGALLPFYLFITRVRI